jgi:hypothetical protein
LHKQSVLRNLNIQSGSRKKKTTITVVMDPETTIVLANGVTFGVNDLIMSTTFRLPTESREERTLYFEQPPRSTVLIISLELMLKRSYDRDAINTITMLLNFLDFDSKCYLNRELILGSIADPTPQKRARILKAIAVEQGPIASRRGNFEEIYDKIIGMDADVKNLLNDTDKSTSEIMKTVQMDVDDITLLVSSLASHKDRTAATLLQQERNEISSCVFQEIGLLASSEVSWSVARATINIQNEQERSVKIKEEYDKYFMALEEKTKIARENCEGSYRI